MAFGTRRSAPASHVGQLPSKTLAILVADKGLRVLLNKALEPCSSTRMKWWETPHGEEWKCESSQKAQNSAWGWMMSQLSAYGLGLTGRSTLESLWVSTVVHGIRTEEATFRYPQEALCSKAIMGWVEGQDPGGFWHVSMTTSIMQMTEELTKGDTAEPQACKQGRTLWGCKGWRLPQLLAVR